MAFRLSSILGDVEINGIEAATRAKIENYISQIEQERLGFWKQYAKCSLDEVKWKGRCAVLEIEIKHRKEEAIQNTEKISELRIKSERLASKCRRLNTDLNLEKISKDAWTESFEESETALLGQIRQLREELMESRKKQARRLKERSIFWVLQMEEMRSIYSGNNVRQLNTPNGVSKSTCEQDQSSDKRPREHETDLSDQPQSKQSHMGTKQTEKIPANKKENAR